VPRIEVFGAGCPLCEAVAQKINSLAGPECSVKVYDLRTDAAAVKAATQHGIQRVPSIVVDGRLAACCATAPVDEAVLRAAGVGACRT
jgi:glutaredoxin 3